jgi:hypothetical protein
MPEFPQQFNDERICGEYLIALRWPGGFACHCGSRHAVRLKARADTFECLDCGRQTSVTAGTVMHGSRLSLRQWFLSVHMFADHAGTVPAARLRRSLGIGRTSAALLKRKLDRLVVENVPQGMLEGPVAVIDGKIRLFADDTCTLIVVRDQNSGHFRAAVLSDESFRSIERFLSANVMSGTTLYYFHNKYKKSAHYHTKPASSEWEEQFSFIRKITNSSKKFLLDEVELYIHRYIAQLNSNIGARPTFENLLRLIVTEKPMSYWDMIDVENPRVGRPTIRRSPRRRKTAYGMRQDGSKRGPNPNPTPEP